jgi:hypothetical protein
MSSTLDLLKLKAMSSLTRHWSNKCIRDLQANIPMKIWNKNQFKKQKENA